MKTTVITVVSGRHKHLTAQIHGLHRSSLPPSEHVVVSMGDDDITDVVRAAGSNATVVRMDTSGPLLPLASARNLGARIAMSNDADLLVFLDVDCIPGVDMLARYATAADGGGGDRNLLCGPVTYLPPSPSGWSAESLHAATDPHPARPNPPPDAVLVGTDYDLFWSLSFASTPNTWAATGGFDENYVGYGGEDTDFAATARAAGVGLRWVGGAHAYHQHHPVSSPPVERLDDIIRNSALFHRRWNRWPMTGWLDEFERRGLIERDDSGEIRRIG
ncbi:glycosyltransferase family 2 protein [Rhodococcus sovatensis]|uniref:Galactosyltransferase-related protein n=1 Tax=Rhodococcus sovatensis TaxID=1805840 RepID=A0ABZ2PCA9_9NOCA